MTWINRAGLSPVDLTQRGLPPPLLFSKSKSGFFSGAVRLLA
jgi:hypothetical protein